MKKPAVEKFARQMSAQVTEAVRSASEKKTDARQTALSALFANPEVARTRAAMIKDEVLNRHADLLQEFRANAENNGFHIHFAANGEEANQIIVELCRNHLKSDDSKLIVKAKSMATEEIELNHVLAHEGFTPIETDLGEYVVQIDHDTPSHIVTPIIHKKLKDVAKSFARENLGPYTENPEELTMQARRHLRDSFMAARIGISGVNFGLADTGQLVLVENEGNNRFSTTAPTLHIALMGIEKLLPRASDLPLFLKLLAGSATGQKLTAYTHIIGKCNEAHIPEVHIVLLDNGRSGVLTSKYREVLRCIRCGACLNGCPVYRDVSGHAYQNVYPGPIGAVFAPAMWGVEQFGDLPFASSLCGLCEEVCPVKIPLPRMLIELREEAVRKRHEKASVWKGFEASARNSFAWRQGIKTLGFVESTGLIRIGAMLNPYSAGWAEFRELPSREGRDFRTWFRNHRTTGLQSQTHRNAQPLESDGELSLDSPSPFAFDQLWERFKLELGTLHGEAVLMSEASFESGLSIIADDDVSKSLLEKLFPSYQLAESAWDADVGVTLVDLAIAESGSIFIKSNERRSRLNSLAPPRHVAILNADQLVFSLENLDFSVDHGTSVIVTGPSRTSDIEGISIRGVHGPGRISVIVSDFSKSGSLS